MAGWIVAVMAANLDKRRRREQSIAYAYVTTLYSGSWTKNRIRKKEANHSNSMKQEEYRAMNRDLDEVETQLTETCRILGEEQKLQQRKGGWFWACGEMTPYAVKIQELHERTVEVYVYIS